MNGNTEQAQCAISRVCIPYEKEKKLCLLNRMSSNIYGYSEWRRSTYKRYHKKMLWTCAGHLASYVIATSQTTCSFCVFTNCSTSSVGDDECVWCLPYPRPRGWRQYSFFCGFWICREFFVLFPAICFFFWMRVRLFHDCIWFLCC